MWLKGVAVFVAVVLCTITTLGTEPEVSLPDTLKLSRLVDLTAEFTGQKYSYQPSELDSITVTLRGMKTVSIASLPETLNQVLASHRFTTVHTPDSLTRGAPGGPRAL